MQPWYVKPTIMNQWGPGVWKIWFHGGVLPGDKEDKYYPAGFIACEPGPTKFSKGDRKEMKAEKERLESGGILEASRCPFLVIRTKK